MDPVAHHTPPASSELFFDDSFAVIPRNCDTAVVYWNLTSERQPVHSKVRLCLQVNGKDGKAEETIYLHRESGHFIVPLLADDREYTVALGYTDSSGFHSIFEQSIRLPEYTKKNCGCHE
jgi:hypothetical protein